jgi:ferrous iron transport protein B
VLRSTWERAWSFIKRAGTVILAASVLIWFTSSFGFEGGFHMVEDMNESMLAAAGGAIAPIFAPLGFGNWQSTVASVMGLVAKEEVVGVFGVLYGVAGDALAMVDEGAFEGLAAIAVHFTALSAFSFLIFNLLCAPCFAAMGAIKREMNSAKWTWFAIGYLCIFAYTAALIVYQLGLLIAGNGFTVLTAIALLLLGLIVWLIVRRNPYEHQPSHTIRRGVMADV